MEFTVATSTLSGFITDLMGGTVSMMIDVVTMVWPVVITVAAFFLGVYAVKRLLHLGR